jgi:hypothetical protein
VVFVLLLLLLLLLLPCLQVALPRALGGLEAMLMYIDTEGKFSTQVSKSDIAVRHMLECFLQLLTALEVVIVDQHACTVATPALLLLLLLLLLLTLCMPAAPARDGISACHRCC